MTCRAVYLHIGLHKTGTTYLQNVLRTQDVWLRDRSYLFPLTGRALMERRTAPQAFSGHSRLLPALEAPGSCFGQALAASLREEVAAAEANAVLISAEHFSKPEIDVEKLDFSALEAVGPVLPIVYLRRQDAFGASIYSEISSWASSRLDLSLEEFLDQWGPEWLDFESRLAPWFRRFGSDGVIVRSYDDAALNGGLLADFCSVVGLEEAPPVDPGDRSLRYPSLNPAIMTLMRAANRREDLTPDRKIEISYALKSKPQWRPHADETGATPLATETWSRLALTYREMNARLARNVIQGRATEFLFPGSPPARSQVKQRYSMEEAMAESLRLWPPVQAEPVPTLSYSRRAPVTASGRPQIAVLSLQSPKPDDVQAFASYHLALGIDRVSILLEDPASVLPEPLADPRIKVTPWPDRWQLLAPEAVWPAAFAAGAREAFADGIDWLICLDGDELLYGDLDAALAGCPAETKALRLQPLERALHRNMVGEGRFASRLFKRLPKNSPEARRDARKAYAFMRTRNFEGFFGSDKGKVMLHRSAEVHCFDPADPSHARNAIPTAETDLAAVLRFAVPDCEKWASEWKTRALEEIAAGNLSKRRRAILEETTDVIATGDRRAVERVWWEWYAIGPQRYAVLEELGLAQRIRLPRRTFALDMAKAK